MLRSFIVGTCILLASASVAAGPAGAQDQDDWDMGPPPWHMEHMMSGDWGPGGATGWWRPQQAIDRVDGRLAYMKAELKITPEQSGAWDDFANALKSAAAAHNETVRSEVDEFRSGKLFEQSLPERLTWQISQLESRLAQAKAVKAATDKLYVVLSEEQKVAADDIVLPVMGMGRGRHMMHW